ncbi:tripartite tricarboxylate transporter permease [Segeticoccus rhizosphaerae]|uniref:tripartite tricarboxylate transporter permease n=1 Tax=Segeticoccus rhizosphaerae TaxID=1104777 RepID=UPI0010BF77AA|nr:MULTISPECIES: tripartite tricarboxylate transporter permease [Intrasporangiaceae]
MLDAALNALAGFANPATLMMLAIGVAAGLAMGVLPGLGGTAAVGILLPFVITLDPSQSLPILIGAVAVVHHSDVITAILLRVPGSASAAVIMPDGNAMARRGQAARALSLCFVASMIGGALGAVGLTFSIPIAEPLVLAFGSPELFMLTILGISLAALLSKGNMLKGLVSAGLGLLIGMIGAAPAAAVYRFSFGADSLLDGVGLIPLALGLFGLAEIAHMVARKTAIAEKIDIGGGWLQGAREALREWKMMLRGVLVGMWAGVLPGLGATAGTYMAYGQAAATAKGKDRKAFGKGSPKGLVAAESAANSVEAGDLIPTLLFGIPGGAPAALLLGALLAYGIQPGPQMLTNHLDVMYTVVWSFAIASVVGSVVCFFLAKPLARLSFVPFQYLAPGLLLIMLVAAYAESGQFGAIVAMLVLGVMGYVMKEADFPRAPLLIGFILSVPMERYYFLTDSLYTTGEWIHRPFVIVMALILLAPLALKLFNAMRRRRSVDDAGSSVTDEREQVQESPQHVLVGASGGSSQRATGDVGGGVGAGWHATPTGGGSGDAELPDDAEEGGLAGSRWPLVFGVLVLGTFVVAFVLAQGYASRARLMPVFVTVLGIALTGLFVAREGRAVVKGDRRVLSWNLRVAQTGLAFGWLLLFVVLVFLLGFSVATLIYVPLFLIRVSRLSPLRTVAYTMVAVAVLAVAYLYGNIDLPGGILLPALPVLYG